MLAFKRNSTPPHSKQLKLSQVSVSSTHKTRHPFLCSPLGQGSMYVHKPSYSLSLLLDWSQVTHVSASTCFCHLAVWWHLHVFQDGSQWEKCGNSVGLLISTITLISSLPCFHTCWHASPMYIFIIITFTILIIVLCLIWLLSYPFTASYNSNKSLSLSLSLDW